MPIRDGTVLVYLVEINENQNLVIKTNIHVNLT